MCCEVREDAKERRMMRKKEENVAKERQEDEEKERQEAVKTKTER